MSFRRWQPVHGEAFKLMKYVDEAGNVEWIWNSRDGVTPFIVTSLQGLESHHVDWREDQLKIEHVPAVGDRIFVDMTEGRARDLAARNVERFWNAEPYPMREAYPSKDEATAALMAEYLDDHGSRKLNGSGPPDLIEVTQGMIDAWGERQAARTAVLERVRATKAAWDEAMTAEVATRGTFASFLLSSCKSNNGVSP